MTDEQIELFKLDDYRSHIPAYIRINSPYYIPTKLKNVQGKGSRGKPLEIYIRGMFKGVKTRADISNRYGISRLVLNNRVSTNIEVEGMYCRTPGSATVPSGKTCYDYPVR